MKSKFTFSNDNSVFTCFANVGRARVVFSLTIPEKYFMDDIIFILINYLRSRHSK